MSLREDIGTWTDDIADIIRSALASDENCSEFVLNVESNRIYLVAPEDGCVYKLTLEKAYLS